MKDLRNWASVILVIVSITACDQQSLDETGELDSGTAQSSLNNLSFHVHNDVVGMLSTDGVKSLTSLLDLMSVDDAFSGRIDMSDRNDITVLQSQLNKFKDIFIPSSSVQFLNTDPNLFDFQSNLGVYNWNEQSKMFLWTESEFDYIQINFPVKGSVTNNASLQILNYQEQESRIDGENAVVPNSIVANLLINEILQASLSYNVSWTEANTVQAAQIGLFIAPFDFSLTFETVSSNQSRLTSSIFRDDLRISNSSNLIGFNPDLKDEIISLESEIAFRAHLVSGTIDIKGINAINPQDDINDFIDITFYDNGKKIGDVLLVNNAIDSSSYDAYILYGNGSKELLDEAFSTVLDEIENFILEIEGEA